MSSITLRTLPRLCGFCLQMTKAKGLTPIKLGRLESMAIVTSTSTRSFSVSGDPPTKLTDYPAEVEVSYDEFKYVEQLLPKATVPEIPHHSSYPTPSGWVPPNDELRSQQPYLVRRTKNHVLPVYPSQKEVWGRIMHHVTLRGIEGDIWKLESELRNYLKDRTQRDKIITQVHEVGRFIRVRGQHRSDIAQFLLDKGM